MYSGRRRKFPCKSYSGNLCSGFGGSMECWSCGWDRYEHYQREQLFNEFLEKEYPKYNFAGLIENHPDVEFTIRYNEFYDWWEVNFEGLMFEVLRTDTDLEKLFRLCCIEEWKKS